MKRLLQLFASLFLVAGLTGCCYSPGFVDQSTGVMYGGGWEPCRLPDPFAIFGCGSWGSACCGSGVHSSNYSSGCCDTWGSGTVGLPSYQQSVPAGVYEEFVPSQPPGPPVAPAVPMPTPADPMTSSVPPTQIIYGRPATFVPQQSFPVQDARASRWVPARF